MAAFGYDLMPLPPLPSQAPPQPDQQSIMALLQALIQGQGPQPNSPDQTMGGAPPPMPGLMGVPPLPQPPPAPSMIPQGQALQPNSPQEQAQLGQDAQSFGMAVNASGAGPAWRSGREITRGNPVGAAGQAALAMMPFRPALGMATLGGAYGGALAQTALENFGLGVPGAEAQQQGRGGRQPPPVPPPLPGLDATQMAELLRLERRLTNEDYSNPAQRRQIEQSAKAIRDISTNFISGRNTATVEAEAATERSRLQEFDRRTTGAERALAEAQRQRVRPFRETPVGSLYEATGGWTPAAMGFGTSALARVIGRPRGEAALEGMAAGAVTPNAPLVWDMFSQPVANPERTMYQNFARDLPATHPEQGRWQAYADRQPEENPARRLAADEFYNPGRLAERLGIGGLEGIVGGLAGGNLAEGGRAIASGIRTGLGNIGSGLGNMFGRGGGSPPPPAAPMSVPRLGETPPPTTGGSLVERMQASREAAGPPSAATGSSAFPRRIVDRNGVVRYQNEYGNWTSAPRNPPRTHDD